MKKRFVVNKFFVPPMYRGDFAHTDYDLPELEQHRGDMGYHTTFDELIRDVLATRPRSCDDEDWPRYLKNFDLVKTSYGRTFIQRPPSDWRSYFDTVASAVDLCIRVKRLENPGRISILNAREAAAFDEVWKPYLVDSYPDMLLPRVEAYWLFGVPYKLMEYAIVTGRYALRSAENSFLVEDFDDARDDEEIGGRRKRPRQRKSEK